MKKILFSFLLMMLIHQTASKAQWINSISIQPASPTSNDTIRFLVDCSFPSGSCDPFISNVFTSGSDIYGSAQHCVGQLTVICNYTDTFVVEPLAAGNYKFHMQLNMGIGPAPCSPGIAPGPVDSLSFTVNLPASIPSLPDGKSISVIMDQQTGNLRVEIPGFNPDQNATLALYTIEGKILQVILVNGATTYLNARYPAGIYFVQLQYNDSRIQKKFVILH